MKLRGVKIGNNYSRAMDKFYADTPKAVFAAIAFSYATWACGNEALETEEIIGRMMTEWKTLHENEIIPQPPPNRRGSPKSPRCPCQRYTVARAAKLKHEC